MDDKSLLKIAVKHREEFKKKARGLDNYFFVHNDGEITDFPSQPCLGSLEYSRTLRERSAPVRYFVTWPLYRRFTEEPEPFSYSERSYVFWLSRQSAWSPVFITKNVDTILADGAILDCNYPMSVLCQASVALRYMSEYPGIIKTWQILRQVVSRDAAFILAHYFKETSRPKILSGGEHLYATHNVFSRSYMGDTEFTNIISHDRSSWSRTYPAHKALGYHPLNQAWIENKNKRLFQFSISIPLTTVTSEDAWGWKDTLEGYKVSDIPQVVSDNLVETKK